MPLPYHLRKGAECELLLMRHHVHQRGVVHLARPQV